MTRMWLEAASLSGYARLFEARAGSAGAILRFQRVRPPRPEPFQPLRSHDITPAFLDRMIRALRRWKYEIVSLEEALTRAAGEGTAQRFVCLTFDGGSRDLIEHACPVLTRHAAPFTIYLPTGFVDGVGTAWWLALEQVIATHTRIQLMMERTERRFKIENVADKLDAYGYLSRWLRALPPVEQTAAISDLCKRYGADLGALSRGFAMNWDDVARLAADPLVTIGTATVHHPLLSSLTSAEALREMKMGRAVAEAAIGRSLPHFSYPWSEIETIARREIGLATDAGFATAVTGVARPLIRGQSVDPLALPRIAWDGRMSSLRVMRALLAGLPP